MNRNKSVEAERLKCFKRLAVSAHCTGLAYHLVHASNRLLTGDPRPSASPWIWLVRISRHLLVFLNRCPCLQRYGICDCDFPNRVPDLCFADQRHTMAVFDFNSLKLSRHTQDVAWSDHSEPERDLAHYTIILYNRVGCNHDLTWVSWAQYLGALEGIPTDMQSIPSSMSATVQPPMIKCGGMQPSSASLLFICLKNFSAHHV